MAISYDNFKITGEFTRAFIAKIIIQTTNKRK
jgi:hypothetical protein